MKKQIACLPRAYRNSFFNGHLASMHHHRPGSSIAQKGKTRSHPAKFEKDLPSPLRGLRRARLRVLLGTRVAAKPRPWQRLQPIEQLFSLLTRALRCRLPGSARSKRKPPPGWNTGRGPLRIPVAQEPQRVLMQSPDLRPLACDRTHRGRSRRNRSAAGSPARGPPSESTSSWRSPTQRSETPWFGRPWFHRHCCRTRSGS